MEKGVNQILARSDACTLFWFTVQQTKANKTWQFNKFEKKGKKLTQTISLHFGCRCTYGRKYEGARRCKYKLESDMIRV